MKTVAAPVVLRLNSTTFPMEKEERGILMELNSKIVEIEGESDSEIEAHASDVDVVMVVSAHLRAPVILKMSRCRLISRMGTGVDKIDIAAAAAQGILVTNIPDFCTNEVADHTMALLLSVARRLKTFDIEMHMGKRSPFGKDIHRLACRTIGIVGFGRIGKAVAQRAAAFGMRTLAHDPAFKPCEGADGTFRMSDLDFLLAESDYICLLCPLTSATRGMIGMEQFKRMKRTAVLVNTGRGELVVEKDLAVALRSGIISFAALDVFGDVNVFAPRGINTGHSLFSLDNVILTPHVAALSEESIRDVCVRSAHAVVDVLCGRWPEHTVNPDTVPRFPLLPVQCQ